MPTNMRNDGPIGYRTYPDDAYSDHQPEQGSDEPMDRGPARKLQQQEKAEHLVQRLREINIQMKQLEETRREKSEHLMKINQGLLKECERYGKIAKEGVEYTENSHAPY